MSKHIYQYRHHTKKRSHKGRLFALAVIGLGAFGFRYADGTIFSKDSAQPAAQAVHEQSLLHKINTSLPKPEVSPQWPHRPQAAIGAVGYGVIADSTNDTKPVPMASLAKVMAAILIIEKDGVSQDNPGNSILFTADDEALYNKYLTMGGVVTLVKAGETMTQSDALKAMLMGSSNNIADSAVIASFGSVEAYLQAANTKTKELGMNNTTYNDVTGFSPQTVSTASDLVLLGEYAMKNPLFEEIVSTWKTTINNGKTELTNTNVFLDFEGNGVLGIKTGLTDEAGGTYMTAARYKTEKGDEVVALAVTLGAKTHFGAQKSAMPLLEAVEQGFNKIP